MDYELKCPICKHVTNVAKLIENTEKVTMETEGLSLYIYVKHECICGEKLLYNFKFDMSDSIVQIKDKDTWIDA